jgi:large subunit ribosomal protein L23
MKTNVIKYRFARRWFNLNNEEVIKYPIVTEKSTKLLENNQYTFIVDRYSNKLAIKSSIQNLFNVKVIKVNTCHLSQKKTQIGNSVGWKSKYKKAIVTLSENDIINLFDDN